jgi:hypothetical protein
LRYFLKKSVTRSVLAKRGHRSDQGNQQPEARVRLATEHCKPGWRTGRGRSATFPRRSIGKRSRTSASRKSGAANFADIGICSNRSSSNVHLWSRTTSSRDRRFTRRLPACTGVPGMQPRITRMTRISRRMRTISGFA